MHVYKQCQIPRIELALRKKRPGCAELEPTRCVHSVPSLSFWQALVSLLPLRLHPARVLEEWRHIPGEGLHQVLVRVLLGSLRGALELFLVHKLCRKVPVTTLSHRYCHLTQHIFLLRNEKQKDLTRAGNYLQSAKWVKILSYLIPRAHGQISLDFCWTVAS